MTDEPITTPRRQRILFGLPYGLSFATLSAGLTATGRTETAPQLPAPPEKPVEAPQGPIGLDVVASLERPTSAHPGIRWVRRKTPAPKPIKHCTCGRRISANKDHCAQCDK
jgi:hypothetical protein